ncbi:Dual specificity mitogen-activated protein kinase kinase 7 [Aphelenchoides bicaudatus]|nr:Dual specificity mitogen-activated protein kinase kinase 7 [Aphelenchoides bicaudatus]
MHSARSTNTSNTSTYFFIAPFQQRLIEFEGRLRKWRIFNRRSSSATRNTGVETVSPEVKNQRRTRPLCFTSPIPRKTYDNNNMSDRRPRPNANLGWGTPRAFVPEQEVNEKYKLIEENSGILSIGGQIYSNVKPDQIRILSTLGSGTCGTVHRVCLNSRIMAEKEMKRTDNKEETKRIFMDLDVVRKSNACPYIVQCYGYIITEDHLKIYMELMSTCAEKLLHRLNAGFPEEIIGKITLGVANALIFLKEKLSLMHRDIKPSNILLNHNGNVKLCDFGISGQLIDSNAASMSTGCIGYLAPERTNMERKQMFGVWALLWSTWLGKSPPPKITQEEGFSAEFCSFVEQCLHIEASQRPRFKDLLMLDFLVKAAKSNTDVGQWVFEVLADDSPPNKLEDDQERMQH